MQIVETYIDTKLEQTKQAIIENADDGDDINHGFKDWVFKCTLLDVYLSVLILQVAGHLC